MYRLFTSRRRLFICGIDENCCFESNFLSTKCAAKCSSLRRVSSAERASLYAEELVGSSSYASLQRFTARTFSDNFDENVVKALQVDLPRLAFEHDFLMDALLFAAMVHLICSGTPVETLPLFTYRDQALRTPRGAVENVSITNTHAVRGASVLLAAVSFPADRIANQPGLLMSNWMALALGQRNFRAIHKVETLTPGEKSSISTYSEKLFDFYAYKTVAMNEFPNMVYLLGPNSGSGHTSVLSTTECSVNLVIRIARPILQRQASIVEVFNGAELEWCDTILLFQSH
ncbi:hypothetical protein PENARI_c012G09892 [Penicillium arizonense]|uniref:Uncharacterized protein n=1 Tax=Penicillium arizonense TaxID=1835702 RepID=A0A1F5LF43_PENAI|nr:hypothetical protein PENARI_c012G09892 [Penicillium arizonense]OGE51838.1 hypothetical protein PENARI_c012G09892 [Penicillium arizonense]